MNKYICNYHLTRHLWDLYMIPDGAINEDSSAWKYIQDNLGKNGYIAVWMTLDEHGSVEFVVSSRDIIQPPNFPDMLAAHNYLMTEVDGACRRILLRNHARLSELQQAFESRFPTQYRMMDPLYMVGSDAMPEVLYDWGGCRWRFSMPTSRPRVKLVNWRRNWLFIDLESAEEVHTLAQMYALILTEKLSNKID